MRPKEQKEPSNGTFYLKKWKNKVTGANHVLIVTFLFFEGKILEKNHKNCFPDFPFLISWKFENFPLCW